MTRENGMLVNPKNTFYMVIMGKTHLKDNPPITFGAHSVERVSVTKLVGVPIQSNLKWGIHTEHIVSKVVKKTVSFILTHKCET